MGAFKDVAIIMHEENVSEAEAVRLLLERRREAAVREERAEAQRATR